jgi:NAD-dependent SIR2 family protein deacetylase
MKRYNSSNVDGHFERAGFGHKMVECHGSIHYLQAFDEAVTRKIWPAKEQLSKLVVDLETFRAIEPLPKVPSEFIETGFLKSFPNKSDKESRSFLARPNILMFGDYGFVGDRVEAQYDLYGAWANSVAKESKLVIIEAGAGLGVPTVRNESESLHRRFPNSTLIRINPREPHGPSSGRFISFPMGSKDCLSEIAKHLDGTTDHHPLQ